MASSHPLGSIHNVRHQSDSYWISSRFVDRITRQESRLDCIRRSNQQINDGWFIERNCTQHRRRAQPTEKISLREADTGVSGPNAFRPIPKGMEA